MAKGDSELTNAFFELAGCYGVWNEDKGDDDYLFYQIAQAAGRTTTPIMRCRIFYKIAQAAGRVEIKEEDYEKHTLGDVLCRLGAKMAPNNDSFEGEKGDDDCAFWLLRTIGWYGLKLSDTIDEARKKIFYGDDESHEALFSAVARFMELALSNTEQVRKALNAIKTKEAAHD